MKVRLKLAVEIVTDSTELFQFHEGPIKTTGKTTWTLTASSVSIP